ncbi:putative tubby-like protein [Helianthus annuus]|uniref:Putative tubby C-terminal-like domain-containing protein n=1 Tax=Helianthus annuus TaxID=4232 RepID=A0A251S4V6_HELAN|nr:putative tubby-like protein [Helianthus annuus]KAJ0449710.1 putative tubby-like protein [Helianthus annuus]KAJ0471408.1 putative tubby-like protein [Helianthus annuus]KAJ0647028.1 putative tubby-like protein [Helianthus annuus]KAJ0650930.1 putative tubby-like protein [Helianthus annuus]
MTEFSFSLIEKMDEVTQWTKNGNGETFLDLQAKNETFEPELAKWPKPQGLKWHLTLDTNIWLQNVKTQMHKKHTVQSIALGKDTFSVTVYPNVDYAFIVALVVILHEINEEKNDVE